MKNDTCARNKDSVMDECESFAPLCWVKNPFHQVIDTQCSSCGVLPIACQHDGYALDFIFCELGCGATYCSKQCRDVAVNCNHHAMLCVGPYDETHPIYRLKLLALQSGPIYFSTIHLAATLVCCMDPDVIALDESWTDAATIDVAFVGTYELVVEILSRNGRLAVPTCQYWNRLLHTVGRLTRKGTTKSAFASECERLTLSNEWSPQSYLLGASEEAATLMELMDEPAHFFPDTAWTALYAKELTHSCIPTHDIQSMRSRMQEMKLFRIPQANVGDGFATTISMIDNSQSLDVRTEEMHEKGLSKCDCSRCLFERDPSANLISMSILQSLLTLATLQERFDDAMDAIEAIVRLDPTSAISLFSRARVAGWQSDYVRREKLLNEAVRTCSQDKDISDALTEANAYYRNKFNASTDVSPNAPIWDTVDGLEGSVFIAENILDPGECTRMIAAVERYQQNHRCGSWSTSRHYAVPTTDLPLCLVPELLSWFNLQLEERIFPAMEHHFEVQGRLRIFDAFVVKYDANEGQKRLPLHNDQSDYSLTVAMNSLEEYGDGGTYFSDTDVTYKTDIGGIISFRGDLSHAGKMTTTGRRYIIVCFVYEEEV